MHVGGKGGDDDPLIAVFKLPVHAFGHHLLGRSVAGAFHIGGVAQKGQYTLLSQHTQATQVHHAALCGGVNLEVAGHDHPAHRGVDAKAHSVGNGVVHVDKLHLEAPGFHHVSRLVGDQLHLVRQTVLLQLQSDEAAGHGGDMDWGQDLLQGVGQGTDVVLVAMGDEEAPKLSLIFDQIGEVGNHQVHPVHVLFREAHAAVHHDHVLAILQDGDIFTDFVETAQGDNFQFFCQMIYNSFNSFVSAAG